MTRNGWRSSDALVGFSLVLPGAVIMARAKNKRASAAAATGLVGAGALGLAARAAWRSAEEVRHPPKRHETALGAVPSGAVSFSRYRNPIAASQLDAAVELPADWRGYDVDSSDGSIDAAVASGNPPPVMRPSELLAGRQPRPAAAVEQAIEGSELPAGTVWLTPSARYHVKELGPLHAELCRRDIPCSIVLTKSPGEGLRSEISRWSSLYYVLRDVTVQVTAARPIAIVVMNDWGSHAPLMRAAASIDVPTFAKVEGAQDFDNRDTLRRRMPYRTADHIMCQGPYDARHVGSRGVVVGSCRLEDLIALGELRLKERREPFHVVANYNFSYGTRSYAAPQWLRNVAVASARVGGSLDVSVHPAVTVPAGYRTCKFPLAFELERASAFVTRSSTALFDAAALGTAVAYFTPHNELAWDDLPFDDAVPRVRTTTGLEEWLDHALGGAPGDRDSDARLSWLKRNFLSVTDQPSDVRMADLIERVAC